MYHLYDVFTNNEIELNLQYSFAFLFNYVNFLVIQFITVVPIVF